jgi:hypothetical protein
MQRTQAKTLQTLPGGIFDFTADRERERERDMQAGLPVTLRFYIEKESGFSLSRVTGYLE